MWWLILACYAVPMIGGVVWSGRAYGSRAAGVRITSEREGWYQGREDREVAKVAQGTLAGIVASIFWPLVLPALVLYYVIASPFLIGKHLGRREAERKEALRGKYTEQADYLRLLARDEDDAMMQEILRSGADALVQQAREL